MLRTMTEGQRGRYLVVMLNWSPAMVFFVLYLANQNLLFLTYAAAFALWQQVNMLRGI